MLKLTKHLNILITAYLPLSRNKYNEWTKWTS